MRDRGAGRQVHGCIYPFRSSISFERFLAIVTSRQIDGNSDLMPANRPAKVSVVGIFTCGSCIDIIGSRLLWSWNGGGKKGLSLLLCAHTNTHQPGFIINLWHIRWTGTFSCAGVHKCPPSADWERFADLGCPAHWRKDPGTRAQSSPQRSGSETGQQTA